MIKVMDKLHPFNSPIECGLRALVLLEGAYPLGLDLQRLVFYDYLMVHSGDANGPSSLHPATPFRSGEVLVKRNTLEQGLLLMTSRSLISRSYTTEGIHYSAGEDAAPFLDTVSAKYVARLRERSKWVIREFYTYSDKDLEQYFYKNLDRWGGEFEKEAALHYDVI